jgi:replication factor A1
LDPDVPEGAALKEWWDNGGADGQFKPLGNAMRQMGYLAIVNEQKLGINSADYFEFYGTLVEVPISPNRQIFYLGCPSATCKHRRVSGTDGDYSCQVCVSRVEKPVPQFAFQYKMADFSGSTFLGTLGDDSVGEALLGATAEQWAAKVGEFSDEQLRRIANMNHYREFKVKCRVKTDDYGGHSRRKFSTLSVTPIDYAEAAKFFASEIRHFH